MPSISVQPSSLIQSTSALKPAQPKAEAPKTEQTAPAVQGDSVKTTSFLAKAGTSILGAGAGAQATALFGGGAGLAISLVGTSNIPTFHRILAGMGMTLGGAAAGSVVGAASGLIAASVTDSPAKGAGVGAGVGAAAGAAAIGALMLKSGKAFDPKALLAGAAAAAVLGAAGGAVGALTAQKVSQ